MLAGDRITGSPRLKREDCKRTDHDRDFSKWKILVGPSDWEDSSLGKEGAERYRIDNLPKNSGPGVYEIGIAVCPTALGREIGKLDPECIPVVYLGQAEDVRTRLQGYGRNGAHLGNSCSTSYNTVTSPKCPGLFEEIFSGGYPIVFRWAPMQSKSDALKTEEQLLKAFDYAWNTKINCTRRHDDILNKLKEIASSNIHCSDNAQTLEPFSQKQVGVGINACKFPWTDENFGTSADEESQGRFPEVFKVGRSQPRLVLDRSVALHENSTICGVPLGHHSICRRPPVEGRKRCAEHKGMKIKGSVAVGISTGNLDSQSTFSAPHSSHDSASSKGSTPICGFILADGSPCISQPPKGNKRCLEHKGRRILQPKSVSVTKEKPDHLVSKSKSSEVSFCREVQVQALPKRSNTDCDTICGVVLANGRLCRRMPVPGRVRCAEHKGMRVKK